MNRLAWTSIVAAAGVLQGLALSLVIARYNEWYGQPWPFLRAINMRLADASSWLSAHTVLDLQASDLPVAYVLALTTLGAIYALRTSGAENWDMHFQPESLMNFEPHAFRGGCLQVIALLASGGLLLVVLFTDPQGSSMAGAGAGSMFVPVLVFCVTGQLFFASGLLAWSAGMIVGLLMRALVGL